MASAYCRFYGEKFLWPNFLVDNLKQLRVPDLDDALSAKLASHVKRATAERGSLSGLETTREFLRPSVEDPGLDWNPYSILTPELEAAIASAYGLDDGTLLRYASTLMSASTHSRPVRRSSMMMTRC